jgi:hypothetical protein
VQERELPLAPGGLAVVRLLIDANLSPKVARALGKSGLEAVHVGDVGLLTALTAASSTTPQPTIW